MSETCKQESLVIIKHKNGRLDFEINKKAFTNTSQGIVIGDLYGYISDVNDTFVKMFCAKDKSEFVGKHVVEFLVKEEKPRAIRRSLEAISNKHEMTGHYMVCLSSGEEKKLLVNTTFMKDEQGQNIGFINFIRETD